MWHIPEIATGGMARGGSTAPRSRHGEKTGKVPVMARLFPSAIVVALMLAAGAAGAESTDPVVARVDGEEIRRSDVVEAQQLLSAQYRRVPFERLFEPLLERMINSKLAARAGRKENLHESERVRRQVARFEDQIVERIYLDRRIEAVLTEDAVRRRYADSFIDFKPKEEVSARHILVKTEAEARAVIEELDGGADFADLARTKSTGPSKTKGGDLGYFTRERMVPEFAAAAFALKRGAYTSEPVQTQFGWHVIKLEDRRQTRPGGFEEQKETLRQKMAKEMVAEIVASLKRSATIERFDSNGAPRKDKPGIKAD